MEKADILEMTVGYLRALHCRHRSGVDAAAGHSVERYAAGYRECAFHVGQCLLDSGVSFGAVHDRLMSHLDHVLQTVVDVDSSCGGRLSNTDVESSADLAAAEKAVWTADCDTTGRCSPNTDDDDDRRSDSETASDVDFSIQRRSPSVMTLPTTTVAQLLTSTAATTMSELACRQPLHADCPRTADEFPFLSDSRDTVDYSPSLPSAVVGDRGTELVVACGVKRDVITRVVVGNDFTVSPVIGGETIAADECSDVWRPWR